MTVTLALDPPNLKENEAFELSVTITSHAPYPITILTYATILDVRDAQKCRRPGANFQCVDFDTDTPLQLQDRDWATGERSVTSWKRVTAITSVHSNLKYPTSSVVLAW
jgi:hypothetical protein